MRGKEETDLTAFTHVDYWGDSENDNRNIKSEKSKTNYLHEELQWENEKT